MGLFGKSNSNGSTFIPVYEGYSADTNGDLVAIQEGFQDQLCVMEAMHELAMVDISMAKAVKEGTSYDEVEAEFGVVLEAASGNVFAKIKAFFQKLAGKIKAFFASIVRFFDGMMKSGKEFATKYESQIKDLIKSGKLKEFKAKVHEYTHLDDTKVLGGVDAQLKALEEHANGLGKAGSEDYHISEDDNGADDAIDAMEATARQDILGKQCDSEDYDEELFKFFRNGEVDVDLSETKVDVNSVLNTLKTNKSKDIAVKAESSFNKTLAACVKAIDKAEREHGKKEGSKDLQGDDKKGAREAEMSMIRGAQRLSKEASAVKTVALDAIRAWKTAITERDRVYKQLCIKAFSHKGSK